MNTLRINTSFRPRLQVHPLRGATCVSDETTIPREFSLQLTVAKDSFFREKLKSKWEASVARHHAACASAMERQTNAALFSA
jgi:hypothetical protein